MAVHLQLLELAFSVIVAVDVILLSKLVYNSSYAIISSHLGNGICKTINFGSTTVAFYYKDKTKQFKI